MRKNASYCMQSLLGFIFLLTATLYTYAAAPDREFYELRIYHLKDQAQGERVDKFLKDAYLPSLHRAGISKVGVFKPVESDTTAGKRIYVLIPYQSVEQFVELSRQLEKDKTYQTAGKDYLQAVQTNPPYERIESILMQAFTGMPQLAVPEFDTPESKQVYELRSYEGHAENIYKNKVEMFNEGGEIPLFERLGFNAVFYGEVLAGSRMPNLMYMTSFRDMESRDKHWESFRSDPEWKKLSGMQKYQNNVSHADIFLLHPAEYSDI